MSPEDESFSRLQCPPPIGNRYDYLQMNSASKAGSSPSLKYFFALDLHQSIKLLPRLLGSIVEVVKFLGPQYCAISIVEGRSTDGTYEILSLLRDEIQRIGATYYFSSNGIDPKSGNRLQGLAELRNLALEPLMDFRAFDPKDITVVFMNDVAICSEDIIELIHQRHKQKADMVCGMDWTYLGENPTFYDVWIARGMNGDTFFNIPSDGNWDSAWNLFWNDYPTKEKFDMGQPLQVFSCWNGAAAFTAEPFMKSKIKFRKPYDGECTSGEPELFCKDLWQLGYGKIAVVPSVNLEYSNENAEKIKELKGYVSRWVDIGQDDQIQWKEDPPAQVKCMPTYKDQFWEPWDAHMKKPGLTP